MPAPTVQRWMATRSRNATAHPGVVDISIEETADNLPKTPAPKKRKPRSKKDIKSAEEVEAGIQRVAAYERQSLNEELVDATPQVVYTPAPPRDPSEPHESSEHDEGGNIFDNALYQPPSESVGDVLMSEAEVGSLPPPVRKAVDQGKKAGKKSGKKGKKAVVLAREESSPESDDEPTPFKKVMSEKGKRFGKDISVDAAEESTPIKAVTKGTRKVKVPVAAEDSATESDEPIVPQKTGKAEAAPTAAEDSATESDEPIAPQKTGNAKVAPTAAKQVLKAPAVAGLASGSDDKSVGPIPATSRPKPRPFKQPNPPVATSAPKKAASKPASNPRPSNEKPDKPQPKSTKARPPKAKSELSMAREALKNAQEDMKKAREEAKRLKESTREPGVRDRIKAVNDGENVKAQSLHPPRLSHLSNSSKSSTHQGEDIASSKPKPKSNAKANEHPFDGIYDFGSDNDGDITLKPNQESQGPPMDETYDFGSFDDGLKLDFEGGSDNGMEIDVVAPATKAVGSSKPKTIKKVVASGSGLAKSGNASGGKSVKASEEGKEVAKSMVKGKAEKGIHEQDSQASHPQGLIVDRLTPGLVAFDQKSTNTGKKRSSTTTDVPKPHGTSNNDKPGPPSKKRKAERDPIAAWIDNIKPNALPPSRAASSTSKTTSRIATSSHPPPSLTTGSTRSSNSTLTNTIRITQNSQLPTTAVKKEPKEARIEVEDKGIFSDYDETEGQERERALASGVKHGVRATSSNMVTEDPSKSVAPPPKASKPFKKAGLPDGLDYELLRRTVIPTVIAYYARQRDPWDRPASILSTEIRTIIRHTGRVDFEVDPKGTIYKNVTQRLSDSWRAVIGSVSMVLITTFIFENQKSKFPTQEKVTAWANKQLTNWRFLYVTTEGNDTKQWRGLFRNAAILGTFAAHLAAVQGAKRIPDLEADGVKPAFPHAYGALALCAAGVQHALLLYGTETITLEMIQNTGKAPSRLPKTFNQSTGKYSTRATGFNDVSWGEPTRKLVQLVVHTLRPESYDKIVAGATAIAAKTRRTIRTDEVIDLTADEPPVEFAMVVDNSSDDEDRNVNGYEIENSGDEIEIEDQDNIKIEDEEEIEDEDEDEEQDEEQDAMEDEYEEENNWAVYEDDEDEGN